MRASTRKTCSHRRGRTVSVPGAMGFLEPEHTSGPMAAFTTTSPSDSSRRFSACCISGPSSVEFGLSPVDAGALPTGRGGAGPGGGSSSRCGSGRSGESVAPRGVRICSARSGFSHMAMSAVVTPEMREKSLSWCDCWNSRTIFSSSMVLATTSFLTFVTSVSLAASCICTFTSFICSRLFSRSSACSCDCKSVMVLWRRSRSSWICSRRA
mmetsp:Transcript_41702/g.107986  ORF Transcript_41702/g.107986 Transcript_41702/m.107986 type:complete len:211 (-) Transcript_41702:609-1241(-)